MSSVSIVLADDHPALRQRLCSLLEREPGYVVVGEAADGLTAVEQVARLLPDVLVVDLMMPGMSGLAVIRQVHERAAQTRVVVLSMHADPLYVHEAFNAGALGYALKEAPAAEFVEAVRAAAQGRRYTSRALAENMQYAPDAGTNVADLYDLLTDDERAVLQLVAAGHSPAAIAGQLALSVSTVESYRTSVLHKLDLRDQAELVDYAFKRGILLPK